VSGASTKHYYPADLVRVLTFGCVIAVHTASTTNPLDSEAAGAVAMLLHFTREAFFILTGFVLTMRYQRTPPRPAAFWCRRLLLVGMPYVVWSVVYTLLWFVPTLSPAAMARQIGYNLVTGTAWYHLYFLLVSMQFYLLFPLFRRVQGVAVAHPWRVLAGSAALQVPMYVALHDSAPTGVLAAVIPHTGSIVLTYQFFFVVGALAALHRSAVEAWVRRHPRLLIAAVVGTGALAEGWYWRSIARGGGAVFATDVFQPVMIPWAVAVIAGFLALGLRWAERRERGEHGRGSRFIEHGSDRSFGVFLVHPTLLYVLTGPFAPGGVLAAPWSSMAVYLVAVAGSLALVEVFRHSPLCLALTGKHRSGRRSKRLTGSVPTEALPVSPAVVGPPPGVARGDLT
jgi:peptidoglycan/LPS O-acetylase OafA/YrhL